MYKGCKNAGQTSVHLPHLKQAVGSGILAFSSDKHNIPYLSQSIEVGVRVEVRKEILEDLCNIIYDPSIFSITHHRST